MLASSWLHIYVAQKWAVSSMPGDGQIVFYTSLRLRPSADRPLYALAALGICFVELHERRCMATRRDDIYVVVWRRVARLS